MLKLTFCAKKGVEMHGISILQVHRFVFFFLFILFDVEESRKGERKRRRKRKKKKIVFASGIKFVTPPFISGLIIFRLHWPPLSFVRIFIIFIASHVLYMFYERCYCVSTTYVSQNTTGYLINLFSLYDCFGRFPWSIIVRGKNSMDAFHTYQIVNKTKSWSERLKERSFIYETSIEAAIFSIQNWSSNENKTWNFKKKKQNKKMVWREEIWNFSDSKKVITLQ